MQITIMTKKERSRRIPSLKSFFFPAKVDRLMCRHVSAASAWQQRNNDHENNKATRYKEHSASRRIQFFLSMCSWLYSLRVQTTQRNEPRWISGDLVGHYGSNLIWHVQSPQYLRSHWSNAVSVMRDPISRQISCKHTNFTGTSSACSWLSSVLVQTTPLPSLLAAVDYSSDTLPANLAGRVPMFLLLSGSSCVLQVDDPR